MIKQLIKPGLLFSLLPSVFMKRSGIAFLAMCFISLFGVSAALAQATKTWDVGGGDNKWTTGANVGRRLLWLCLFLFTTGIVQAQVAVDNSAQLNGAVANTTFTLNNFTVGSCTNRLLIVALSLRDIAAGKEVQSVTYGGVALTEVGTSGGVSGPAARIQFFRLLNPASGTANIVTTGAQANKVAIGVISFFGANQTTPIDLPLISASGEGASSTINVASQTNWMVVDAIGTQQLISGTSQGNTSRWRAAGDVRFYVYIWCLKIVKIYIPILTFNYHA